MSTPADALANTVDLARRAERLGYHRYWLAEHHNTEGIASSVPEVMIAQVANATSTIRVGSGGMMLPNHSPLKVVETFRVLETLHPGRIDLGIGRAPGTDMVTALALRRSRAALAADDFPQQLAELLAFFYGTFPDDHPFRTITPVPAGTAVPPIYLLGSSEFSGQVAAQAGLGFAFARHISPGPAAHVLSSYRDEFRPSAAFPEPSGILATSVLVAETDERAEELAASLDLMWLRIGQGTRGPAATLEEARRTCTRPPRSSSGSSTGTAASSARPRPSPRSSRRSPSSAASTRSWPSPSRTTTRPACAPYELLAEAAALVPAA